MVIIASFLIAALMGMGVGGGGLFVIFLTLCLDYPQPLAQGTNLLFFVITGGCALIYHLRKRKIYPWQVILSLVLATLGSLLFSRLANNIDPKYPRICLGILLISSGIYSIYNSLIKPPIKKFKKPLYK